MIDLLLLYGLLAVVGIIAAGLTACPTSCEKLTKSMRWRFPEQ